jgi:hypothetical protein
VSAHEMQHPDSPTWCIHCGTFDVYCGFKDCVSDRERRFDMSVPENWKRTLRSVFPVRMRWTREMPESQGVRERS